MVELSLLNLIIKKSVINEKCPSIEDIDGYLFDESRELFLNYSYSDDYLYCINFTSYELAEEKLKILVHIGFEPITIKNGKLSWKDFCVIDLKNNNINLPCDWLNIFDNLPVVSYCNS